MKYQRVVSLTLLLSFVAIILSSGVLYLIADRRVTQWSDWSFLWLDKQQWDNLHINFGFLFLGFLVWHIYYNWKPIKNYLKKKREFVIFTKEFNFSLILVTLVSVGTIWMVLPLSFIVNIGNGIKAINIKDETPPFAYAEEAIFRDFCLILDINQSKALNIMQENSISISSKKQTLKQIATLNNTTPMHIYALIRTSDTRPSLPTDLPVGIAYKSIKQLSIEYKIDTQRALEHLKSYGIITNQDTSFKKISKIYLLHPATLYNILLASQAKS